MSKLKHHRLILVPICVMLIIWFFSSMPGSISNSQSLPIAHSLHLSHLFTRKLAHMLIYALLGLAWFIYLRSILPKNRPLLIIVLSIILSFFAACLDECHQLFVPHRSGLFSDVIIDTLSASCSILGFSLVLFVIKHFKSKPKPNSNLDFGSTSILNPVPTPGLSSNPNLNLNPTHSLILKPPKNLPLHPLIRLAPHQIKYQDNYIPPRL